MRTVHRIRGGRALGGFRARLEPLEQRQCLSVTVTTVDLEHGTELRITGNGDDDTINIVDSGSSHVDVTDGGGAPLGSADDVVRISVDAGGGNDTVNYTLAATLANRQSLFVRLGEGADQAHLDLSAGIADARLVVFVDGGVGDDVIGATVGTLTSAQAVMFLNGHSGNDQISVNGAPVVTPTALVSQSDDDPAEDDSSEDDEDSRLLARLNGGLGDDTLAANLGSAIADHIHLGLSGNGGDDHLSVDIPAGPPLVPVVSSLSEEDEEDGEPEDEPSIHVRLDGGLGDDALSATVGAGAGRHLDLQLNGGAGDDELSLTTLGPPAEALPQIAGASLGSQHPNPGGPETEFELYGGGGDDTLNVVLGSIAAGHVKLDLDGGSGDDVLTLLATGANIGPGASLHAKLEGGAGDDTVNGTYDGLILGVLRYAALGGPGDDTLVSNLTAAAGSTGTLGAASAGGSGADHVTLNVFDNSGGGGPSLLAALHALIFDPGGHDTLVHTDNVKVILNNGGLGKHKDEDS